jgi:hypothetical protein
VSHSPGGKTGAFLCAKYEAGGYISEKSFYCWKILLPEDWQCCRTVGTPAALLKLDRAKAELVARALTGDRDAEDLLEAYTKA